MFNSLWLQGLQWARCLCPLLSPRVFSNSCPLSQWCYATISCSVARFSSCPQSFPASGSFPMSRLFATSGQSIRASAIVLSVNIQSWFPLGLTGWLSLLSKGLSRVFSNTTVQKHQFFSTQCSNYCTIGLISHTSKVMLKILQARLQQAWNGILFSHKKKSYHMQQCEWILRT